MQDNFPQVNLRSVLQHHVDDLTTFHSTPREKLPRDADNYDVYCERCRRVHRYFTFTQEDYDRATAAGAQRLALAIDARAFEWGDGRPARRLTAGSIGWQCREVGCFWPEIARDRRLGMGS